MSWAFSGDEVSALVFDIGARTSRIGYAGADAPAFEVTSVTGYLPEDPSNRVYGETALKATSHSQYEMGWMLANGRVLDWDVYDGLLTHAYADLLRTDPAQHPVLCSEHLKTSRHDREKLCEVMFEKYLVPAFHLVKSPVLSAFSQGKSTALVLDLGHTGTLASAVFEGCSLQKTITESPVAGQFLLREYTTTLGLITQSLLDPALRKLKEAGKISSSYEYYRALDRLIDLTSSTFQINDQSPYNKLYLEQLPRVSYELPDGTILELSEERFRIPEMLFDTRRIGPRVQGDLGLHNLVLASVAMSDVEIKNTLMSNIMCVGGLSQMNGLNDRLLRELQQRNPNSSRLRMVQMSNNERRNSAFIGGSIVASMSSFHQRWISKHEYEECGSQVIERKCD